MVASAAAVFTFAWYLRFNAPGGAFAGLTDDHFFYLVRGWQILFGELPVRDFVDHGAPLHFYLAAAVQIVLGRGTASELLFTTTILSVGAALVFWSAARASGWIALGLLGGLVHVLLEPRFYNYPKALVYAVAIPVLWRFVDSPTRWPRFWVAVVTAIGFLLRHDHGALVAVGFAALLALHAELPWRTRLRHGVVYAALVVALLSPYLLFLQVNGGVVPYVRQAAAWAARDRERAPVVWPGLFDSPNGTSDAATRGSAWRSVATVRDNGAAWMYYTEIALPLLALLVLAVSRDGWRPGWPRAVPKIGAVAVLGLALDAAFLRSPLAARLADPSVPHAVLIAWLAAAVPSLLIGRASWRPSLAHLRLPLGVGVLAMTAAIAFVLGAFVTTDLYDRLDQADMATRPRNMIERAVLMDRRLRERWDLAAWREDRPELVDLSQYLRDCTAPTDRVFVQLYLPQVTALANRGFAGGHADLRPGFFTTEDAQRLTIERLRRQSVPLLLLETEDTRRSFRRAFPLVSAYFDQHYAIAGARTFEDRFPVTLWVRGDYVAAPRHEPLGWPCPVPQ